MLALNLASQGAQPMLPVLENLVTLNLLRTYAAYQPGMSLACLP